MHHHLKNQERALNLSILISSGPGESGVKINLSLGFSRIIENAPDLTCVKLFQPKYHISG